MVTDTKPESARECSRCKESKESHDFIKRRNICKKCANSSKQAKYNAFVIDDTITQTCNVCEKEKVMSAFVKKRKKCTDCHNNYRRKYYENNDEHREKAIKQATSVKQKKVLERQRLREEEQARIGIGNKTCRKCTEIKPNDRFRHNRLKCKDCERDEPHEKFKRAIRCRIYISLKNKEFNTIDYLGANTTDYIKWMSSYGEEYNLDNRKEWHIDHVIPLSKFDLDDRDQQLIAFNWRNTMPLSVKENLSKNNRINTLQIELHQKHLLEYHTKHNIELPKEFNELFAKHLVAGTPLEPSLPLIAGNSVEEHG
jgi:uncharacterized protein (DUF983 family)